MKVDRKSKFFLPIVVVLVAAGAIVLATLTKPTPEEKKDEFPPLSVNVVPSVLDEIQRFSLFQGEVRAKTNIDLISQVTGKVVRVSKKYIEGGQFRAGQEIVKIDDADYLVAFRSAEASVAEAKVQLDIELASAATNALEWQDLQGLDITKASPLRLNKPQVDRARARFNVARAELASAKLNLDRTSISAPFDGRIESKGAELGEFVARGASVGRVFATSEMEIRIPMTDSQIADLGLIIGQNLNKDDAPMALIKSQFGNQLHQWPGHLRSIDASIDKETRLLYATVVADQLISETSDIGMPLAPGMFVDVELLGSDKVVGIRVPRSTLRNGNQIYVVEEGKLVFHTVRTIYTSADIAVLSLDDGDVQPDQQVVLSSVPGAFEGMSVEIRAANNSVGTEQSEIVEQTEGTEHLEAAAELSGNVEQVSEQAEDVQPETTDETI